MGYCGWIPGDGGKRKFSHPGVHCKTELLYQIAMSVASIIGVSQLPDEIKMALLPVLQQFEDEVRGVLQDTTIDIDLTVNGNIPVKGSISLKKTP